MRSWRAAGVVVGTGVLLGVAVGLLARRSADPAGTGPHQVLPSTPMPVARPAS